MSNRALAMRRACEPLTPEEESVRRMMERIPEVVDSIGGNLDRALSSLQRIERKLESLAR